MHVTFPLEVNKRCTSVVARVDEVVVGQDGRVRVANDQHGPTAEILQHLNVTSAQNQATNSYLDKSTYMTYKVVPRLREYQLWRPEVAGSHSCNLGPIIENVEV